MQNYLMKYGNDCVSRLSSNISRAKKSSDARNIHSLRLNVKKINALFGFLEILDITLIPKETLKRIDSLYRISGQLRDAQIQIQILKKFKKIAPDDVQKALRYFSKHKKKAQNKLKKKSSRISNKNLLGVRERLTTCIKGLDNNTLKIKCIDYANETLTLIKNIISRRPDEELLHRMRIYLKVLIYILDILLKMKEDIAIDKPSLKLLNTIQQKVGEWHDLDLLYQRLNQKLVQKGKYSSLVPLIENYRKECEEEIYLMLKDIIDLKVSLNRIAN